METVLIVPGLHSSGPDHWQTWFESEIADTVRVIQRDWKRPDLADWASRVRREISRNPGRIFLVAHSFGVLAAVQAGFDHQDRIGGALLVAPADPGKFGIGDLLPNGALGFASIVVASTNDPWLNMAEAARWAQTWGSELIDLGAAGHINADSGYGPWAEGLGLLNRLRRSDARLRRGALKDAPRPDAPSPDGAKKSAGVEVSRRPEPRFGLRGQPLL